MTPSFHYFLSLHFCKDFDLSPFSILKVASRKHKQSFLQGNASKRIYTSIIWPTISDIILIGDFRLFIHIFGNTFLLFESSFL